MRLIDADEARIKVIPDDLKSTIWAWSINEYLDNQPTVEVGSAYYTWHDLRKNPNDLPNEDGWVSCWLRTKDINYGMDLFFKSSNKKFIDNRRKSMFEIYKVIDFFGKQIFTSEEVDRTNSVIAWRYIEPFEG